MLNHFFDSIGFALGVRASESLSFVLSAVGSLGLTLATIAAFMILVMLIFGNLAMTTRLPKRQRGRATVHASAEDAIVHLNPESIPKVNYRTFLSPAYCVTTVGAACIMMGISLPVSYVTLKHVVIRDNVDRCDIENEAISADDVM